ncbi:reverse transcriptase [Gossypium australe]|uniref:Reverse transcriptase n=1 Tax=Gossypium australe TaxID=47621 RepID=A0A5B6VXX7_9ROSI|nr:reverse transcriptase [Gossypium australe]
MLKYFLPAKTIKLRNGSVEKVSSSWITLVASSSHFFTAQEFIKKMTPNNYQRQVMRTKPTKTAGVFNIDAVSMLASQVEALSKKIDGLSFSKQVNLVMKCDAIRTGMISPECLPFKSNMEHEQVDFMGNQRSQPPLNFQQPYQQEKKLNLEEMLTKFILVSKTQFRNISQLAKLVSKRQQGSLPINTETNLKEQVHAITLRSEKVLAEPEKKLNPEAIEKNDGVEECKKEHKSVVREYKPHKSMVREYKPQISYLTKLKKDCMGEQFGKFLKLFKQLHINLHFIEALSQMSKYAKFLKELL